MTSLEPPPPPPVAPPPAESYPVRFDVDYPERLSRLSTAFRLVLLIPVWIYIAIIGNLSEVALGAGWIAIFLKRRYPDWLFRALTGVAGFNARAYAYGSLLTDRFPGFESAGSPVHLEFDEPPNGELSRWRVFFWKLVLLIPQFIVLGFLAIAAFVVVLIAWFAILFTGNYPRGMFAFVTGIHRWYFRVFSYFASFNDRYPPYSLSADAGPASGASTVASGVIGLVATGGIAAAIVVAVIVSAGFHSETVDYAQLQDGVADTKIYVFDDYRGELLFQLSAVHDPGDDLVGVLDLGSGERAIVFEWYVGTIDRTVRISDSRARLDYTDGGDHHTESAVFISVGDSLAPARVDKNDVVTVRAVFVIPETATPSELRWRPGFQRGFKYVFE